MDTKLILFILVLIVLWPGPDQTSNYIQSNTTYLNSYSQDSMSQQLNPSRGMRTSGVFQDRSPESWYFEHPNKSAMLNVPGRGPISGIPAVNPNGSPVYNYDMVQGMNI